MNTIKNVKDYINMPLLYNHWYIAGTTDEFSREPVAKVLLEKPVVFYRTEAGELVALQNRCLHRAFPLSKGKMEGDNIVCGYHGARYNPEGQLVRVPTQDRAPNLKLKKYTVREIGDFVLIWMGDGEADESKFPTPSVFQLGDPNYRTVKGYHLVKGNYLFMQENLHDLSHIPYLHTDTFKVDDRFLQNKPTISKGERGVVARRVHEESTHRVFLAPSVLKEVEGKQLWRVDYGVAPSPGVYEGIVLTGVGESEESAKKEETMNQYIMHFLTPETKKTCHYYYAVSLDHGNEAEDQEFWEHFPAHFEAGFLEDLDACDSMQIMLDQEKGDFKDSHFAGDQHGMMFRRVVLNWAKEEYGDLIASDKDFSA